MIRDYLLARAAETSTWKGLIFFGGGLLGFSVGDATVAQAAELLALIVGGLAGAALPDKLNN